MLQANGTVQEKASWLYAEVRCFLDEVLQPNEVARRQGSYGHEKSWNLKMHFPGLEKSWILGKIAEVMEKSWNFISLGPKISCCLKTGKIPPSHRAKICPQKAGFSAFLSHGKF